MSSDPAQALLVLCLKCIIPFVIGTYFQPWGCRGLNENGQHRIAGSDSIGRGGLDGVGVALSEEVCP